MKNSQNTFLRVFGKFTAAVLLGGLLAGSLTGCDLFKSASWEQVPVNMVVYVPHLPEESVRNVVQGLRVLLDPYEAMPSSQKDGDRSDLRPALLLPDQITIRRLDCPGGSELGISAKDWQRGVFMKIAMAMGNPSPVRYQQSWRDYGLSRITEETMKGMCPRRDADFSAIQELHLMDEGTLFYVVNPQGDPRPDIVPVSVPADKVSSFSSPAALWQNVYARLSEPSRPKELKMAVYYDPIPRCPTSDEILAAYRSGEYAGARGLLNQAQGCAKDDTLENLFKARPTVTASMSYVVGNKPRHVLDINESLRLTTETPYALELEVSRESTHLYVVQIDATGSVHVVYPSEIWCPAQRLQDSMKIRCPQDPNPHAPSNWFSLDENKGLEKLYILGSSVENRRVEEWIRLEQSEDLKMYLQELEASQLSIPGVFFQILAFTNE